MQLFQPTNITPDMRGSFGNGVVLRATSVTTTFKVSWQVNGNTPMTAFQIDFYKNDGSGDLIWSTGKLTDNCPFYSVDGAGNPILFSYTVSLANGLENYDEGQIKITQFWGENGAYSVAQSSNSVYIVRPYLSGDVSIVGATDTRSISFNGSFTGAEEDGLMWHRWVLYSQGQDPSPYTNERTVIQDTGKVYGNAELTFSYDGFLPGWYGISLIGETSAGVSGFSIYQTFKVEYDLSESGMDVMASKACNGESAVEVSWPNIMKIPLTGSSGSHSVSGDYISLRGGMSWDTVNGGSMFISPPWSFLWRGVVNLDTLSQFAFYHIFTLQLKKNNVSAYETLYVFYQKNTGTLELRYEVPGWRQTIASIPLNFAGGELFIGLTPEGFWVACEGVNQNSLLPMEDLYPAENLYPAAGAPMSAGLGFQVPAIWERFTSQSITRVSLIPRQSCRYCKIVSGTVTEQEIVSNYLANEPNLEYTSDTLFLLSKNSRDYDAGNYYIEDVGTLQGVTLYRMDEGKNLLEKVGDFSLNTTKVLDYGARSQQGPYSYYLYVKGANTYTAAPAVSDSVSPCFWNWTVLSCTKNTDGSFTVKKSYLFGKNLESGSIGNNNSPGVKGNFTRYPLVQVAPQNYRSGTLRSLIGTIDYAGGQNEYSDTVDLRDEIYELSTTTNFLFLKNRKGDLWMIRPSGEIVMETMDNTRAQAQTVSFPWVETGGAEGISIYQVTG